MCPARDRLIIEELINSLFFQFLSIGGLLLVSAQRGRTIAGHWDHIAIRARGAAKQTDGGRNSAVPAPFRLFRVTDRAHCCGRPIAFQPEERPIFRRSPIQPTYPHSQRVGFAFGGTVPFAAHLQPGGCAVRCQTGQHRIDALHFSIGGDADVDLRRRGSGLDDTLAAAGHEPHIQGVASKVFPMFLQGRRDRLALPET